MTINVVTLDWHKQELVDAKLGYNIDVQAVINVPQDATPGMHSLATMEGEGYAPFLAGLTLTRDPNDFSGERASIEAFFWLYVRNDFGPPEPDKPGCFMVSHGDTVYLNVTITKYAKHPKPGMQAAVYFELAGS